MSTPSPTAAVLALVEALQSKASQWQRPCFSPEENSFHVAYNAATNSCGVWLGAALAALPDLAEYCVVPARVLTDALVVLERLDPRARGGKGTYYAEEIARLRECLT